MGGVVPGWIEDNNLAEIFAAAEGVALAASLGADRVLLVTDSAFVVRAATRQNIMAARRLELAVRLRVPEPLPRLAVRRVPGHGQGITFDERAIGWCDRQARRALRTLRGRLPAMPGPLPVPRI